MTLASVLNSVTSLKAISEDFYLEKTQGETACGPENTQKAAYAV
jgi:hypothetical protein